MNALRTDRKRDPRGTINFKERARFLSAIFQDIGDDEVICVGHPQSFTENGVKKEWWKQRRVDDNDDDQRSGAWHVCISTVRQQRDRQLRRTVSHLVLCHALLLDDVGTAKKSKVDPAAIKVEPSIIVETSRDNFQYWYPLKEPVPPDLAAGAMAGLAAAGLTDSGAQGANRFGRLPGSVKVGGNFAAKVRLFRPRRRWLLEDLMAKLGAEMRPTGNMAVRPWHGDPGDEPYSKVLASLDMVIADKGLWLDIVCPWANEHSDDRSIAGYRRGGGFRCHHSHGDRLGMKDLKLWLRKAHGVDINALDAEMASVRLAAEQAIATQLTKEFM